MAWYLTQSLPVILATFALGLVVGWLWWGRAWRRVAFAESDAVRAVSDRYRTVVAEREAEISRLSRTPQDPAPPSGTPAGVPATIKAAPGTEALETGTSQTAGTTGTTGTAGATGTAGTTGTGSVPSSPAGTGETGKTEETAETASDGVTVLAIPQDVTDDEEPEAGAPDDLQRIEGVGPRIAAALDSAGLRTYQAVADADEEQLGAALREARLSFAPSLVTWSRQAQLLATGDEEGLAQLKAEITGGRSLAAPPAETTEPGIAADADPAGPADPADDTGPADTAYSPKADSPTPDSPTADDVAAPEVAAPESEAAATPTDAAAPENAPESDEDELERIEGIGPRIATALRKAGIHTYRQLATTDTPTLQAALAASGLRFTPSLPTWSPQAALLADGDEAGFLALTRTLVPDRESGRPS